MHRSGPWAPGMRHGLRGLKSLGQLFGSWAGEWKAEREEVVHPGGAEKTTVAFRCCKTCFWEAGSTPGMCERFGPLCHFFCLAMTPAGGGGNASYLWLWNKVVWFCMSGYLMVRVLLGKAVTDNLKPGRAKSLDLMKNSCFQNQSWCSRVWTTLLSSWVLVESNNVSFLFSKHNIEMCI